MQFNWRGLCGVLAISASVAVLGCGDSPVSYVRTVNGSNGLSNYTLQIGVQGVASSVPYGTVGVQPKGDNYSVNDSSGNYRPIPTGTNQKVLITTTNNTVLSSTTQSFVAKTYYTVVTFGASASPGIKILTDGDAAPSSGDFKLRLMNTATQTGTVDVYVTAQAAPISGPPVASGLQPGQATSSYVNVAAGAVEFQVTPAGNPAKILFTGLVNTTAGNLYTGYFFDPPMNNPAKGPGLLLTPDPAIAATSSGK